MREEARVQEELIEVVLRVVEAIPPGRAATYGMIARAVGTGPRVVGRIMHDWGGGVPWWRVVSVHGTFPTTLRGEGVAEWRREGIPHDLAAGRLLLDACVVDQLWLEGVAQEVRDNLRNCAELSE